MGEFSLLLLVVMVVVWCVCFFPIVFSNNDIKLTEKYKDFGANLELITNKSQEGSQFCKGFGGIGGLLRYKVIITSILFLFDY